MAVSWWLYVGCFITLSVTVSSIQASVLVNRTSMALHRLPRQTRNNKVIFNEPGCGSQKVSTRTKRIIGGTSAVEGEWPWMARLYVISWERKCGAVLITNQHVLTAAHCVIRARVRLDVSDVVIHLGALDLRRLAPHERNFSADALYVHEDYNTKSFDNDIAVIRLATKVDYTNYIQPICLPPKDVILDLKPAVATGWGRASIVDPSKTSDILLKIQITITNQVQCKALFKPLKKDISDFQLCAGTANGDKDTCQGDSGGPLMVQSGSKQWTLAGIVSFGHGCAEPLKPGIYVRVPWYLDWILENLNPVIRIGCPNGFQNFDEFLCIHEYWPSQFQKGRLTWNELLEKREKKETLQPIRKQQLKCPEGYVEYDEFYCLNNFIYQRYQSGKEPWNTLFSFVKSKISLQKTANINVVSPEPTAPKDEPMPMKLEAKRLLARRVPCSETAAAENGLTQLKFDEYHCISPDYINRFKKGEINWFELISRKFQKKLPSIVRIGCPDGLKNIDDEACIDEYWLDQYRKGAITWTQVLERRQQNDGLIAKRKTDLKCPSGHVEFDEFHCIAQFFVDRYLSGKENLNALLGFIKSKMSFQKTNTSHVSPPPVVPSAIPEKFILNNARQEWDKISCNTTEAAKQGLPQIRFDEVFCISSEFFDGYMKGEIDWYGLLSKRFEKKIPVEPDFVPF